jgi:hypothetical protein
MKPALLIVMRTEPVAAWENVGVPAKTADAARTANTDFIARKEPNIVASGTTLFMQFAGCSDSNRQFSKR